MTAFLFLKNWQEGQWGDSWLASKHSPLAGRHVREFWETAAMVPIWNPKRYKTNLMGAVHSLLLLGNGAIVSGGSLLVQSTDGETESSIKLKHTLALVLRSVGSGLFFVAVIYFVACWLASLLQERKTGRTAFHPTLSILGIVAIWLLVRGGFGLLQSAIDSVGQMVLLPTKPSEAECSIYFSCYTCAILGFSLVSSWDTPMKVIIPVKDTPHASSSLNIYY